MPDTDYEQEGPYQLWVVDRFGNKIKELPAKGIEEMTWGLNGQHTMRFKVPTWDPRTQAIELVKREIMVLRGGEIIWWGVPWRVNGDHNALSFECEGLMSYFNKRHINHTSLDYTSLEQRVIAWNLLSHAQTLEFGDLNITAAPFSGTTRIRSRRYERELHEPIIDLISEFPTLDDGFEYDIRLSEGLREWTPYYPRQGTVRNNLLLEWGRNITEFRYNEDAMNLANHVYVTGGASGEVRFEQNYRDDIAAGEYGLMHSVVSDGQQMDIEWLMDRAKEEVAYRKKPTVLPEVTVVNDPVQIFGVVGPGDIIPVRLQVGRVQFDKPLRVALVRWNPGEYVNLSFIEEDAV